MNIKPAQIIIQTRRNEKDSGVAINYVILPATMVARQRKFFISNRLKQLEKLNICRSRNNSGI